MWMEEHIGKRVNHERVEEALDTGASKIATGCPFCRVMITDGVDDVAAGQGQDRRPRCSTSLSCCSARSTRAPFTLPEKGTAAKEAEERAAKEGARHREGGSRDRRGANRKPSRSPRPTPPTETKPVTGLGIAGGAKRPGAKKATAAGRPTHPPPAEPGRSGGTRRACQGTRHRRGRQATRRQEGACRRQTGQRTAAEAPAPEAPAKAEPEVKGLGIAAGAKRPGAKKTPASASSLHPAAAARVDGEPERTGRRPSQRSRDSASRRVHVDPARRRRRPSRSRNPLRRSRNRSPTANPPLRLSLPARATASSPRRR